MTCLYTSTKSNMRLLGGSLKRKRSGEIAVSRQNITDNLDVTLPPRKIIRVVPILTQALELTIEDPQETLQYIATKQGHQSKGRSYEKVPEIFETLPKDVEAWNFEVLAAVRKGDVEQLRVFHQQGYNLQCTNRFGETLMHLACRKALNKVVDFLIHEVGMPLNIHDDMGRTPLHDAFWTPEPNEELIEIMVRQCPAMLFVQDKRGHCLEQLP